ncbi:MAG: Crp/Fnr family transcriptional regulator [Gammaproteobacteria bacterium]
MKEDTALLVIFQRLSEADQVSVISYAEFLASRKSGLSQEVRAVSSANTNLQVAAVIEPIPEPKLAPRPEDESVIKAIKRLSGSYFMLNKKSMLGITSDIMMKHIVQGEDADQVIDELETVFQDAYTELKNDE